MDEDEPRRYKRGSSKLSVADSMVEQAKITAKSKEKELLMLTAERQRHHEAELKQRDQHHAEQMVQHQTILTKAENQMLTQKERVLRLEQELENQKAGQARKGSKRRASNSSDSFSGLA